MQLPPLFCPNSPRFVPLPGVVHIYSLPFLVRFKIECDPSFIRRPAALPLECGLLFTSISVPNFYKL
jgi:hypothetical protein